jgi:DNA-binding response OmpR family regulator
MVIELPVASVLVCEDDPAMIRIFQFLLRQQGIGNVVTASDGAKVAAMVAKHHPALILLDLMLPGRDGLAVLRDLKGNEETRAIPVIVVSGKESHEQVQEAMLAGAIDYVIKPFEPMELGMRIKNFLDTLIVATPDTSLQNPPPSTGIGGTPI